MEAQRALLDELMGAERNLAPEQRTQTRKRHFSDRDVDKMYLVGCSPYELFRRTKSDLGPNPKIPDDECKAAWEELSEQEKRRYGYEEETRRFLEKLVRQVDYRIKDNLARSNPEDPEAMANSALRILELEDEMDETLERLQALAKQGEVVMAFNLYKRVETLRAQRNVLFSVPDSQRLHIVCPVSGNLISRGDNDERLLSHFTGKQYNGWKLVRAKLEELNKSLARPLDSYAGRSFGFGGGGGGGGGYRGNSRPAPAYDAPPRSYSSFERRGGVDRREYERRFPRGDRDAAASATLARERSADRSQDWGRGRDDESHGRRRRSPSYSRGSRKRGRSDEYDYGDGNDRRSRSRYHYSSGDDASDGDADDRDERHGRDRRKSSKKDSKKHKKRHKKHKKHKSGSHKHKKSSSSRHRRRSRSASGSSASDSDSDAEVARRLRERQGRSGGRR